LNIYSDYIPSSSRGPETCIHYQSIEEFPCHMLCSVRALELIVPQATTNSS